MATTRATKKACGSLDTELTPDFIKRAMTSNPLALLSNEALKFLYLFSGSTNPVFHAYHAPIENSTSFSSILFQRDNPDFRQFPLPQVVTAFALRDDVPDEITLYFVSNYIGNKKYIGHIITHKPRLADLDYLLELSYDHLMHPVVGLSTHQKLNPWEVLEFYLRQGHPTHGSAMQKFYKFIDKVIQAKSGTAAIGLFPAEVGTTKYILKYCMSNSIDVVPLICSMYQSNYYNASRRLCANYNIIYHDLLVEKKLPYSEVFDAVVLAGEEVLRKARAKSAVASVFTRSVYPFRIINLARKRNLQIG